MVDIWTFRFFVLARPLLGFSKISGDTVKHVKKVAAMRLLEVVVALVLGAIALFIFHVIGVIIKIAFIAGLIVAVVAYVIVRAIRQMFSGRS